MTIVFRSRVVGDELTLGTLFMQLSSLQRDSIVSQPRLSFTLLANPTVIKFIILRSTSSSHKQQEIEFSPSDDLHTVYENICERYFGRDNIERLRIIVSTPVRIATGGDF